jgi:predicted nuclease of predicted toxin-antitoxin system
VKIVADENVDKQIVDGLRTQGHDVLFIAELDPGIEDTYVLVRSQQLGAILITADKDFGELVFRQRMPHSGILLLRLDGLTSEEKASLVVTVVRSHGAQLSGRFAVLSTKALRLRPW